MSHFSSKFRLCVKMLQAALICECMFWSEETSNGFPLLREYTV